MKKIKGQTVAGTSKNAIDTRVHICLGDMDLQLYGCTAVLNLVLNLALALTSEIIHTKFSAGTAVVLQL